ncbi:MAG: LysR family transcriptional regulator [Opitutaceae bacterium]|jgi:DNA-binding transcriptional LysR family regulator
MEIRHLRYFCGVAEHKSFSRASAKLRVAQPSLSRQIRDLENELGVELFIRSSSGVRLTDAGEAFHTQAAKLLSQLAIAISTAQEIGRGKGGEFIVGGDWRLPLDVVPQAVMQVRKLFPKVDVKLKELPMHEHVIALRDRKIHIGFVPHVYLGSGEGMDNLKILSTDMVVLISRNHHLAAAKRLRLVDLKDETWIGPDEKSAPGVTAHYLQLFRLAQVSPKFSPSASTLQGLIARVSAGDGVAVLPRSVLPERNPHLAIIPCDIDPFDLYAIWPSKGASPLVKPFLKILVDLLKSLKPPA